MNAVGVHRHVLLAFVTSALPAVPESSDLLLLPSLPGFSQTGLRVPSALRRHRMVTVSAKIIRRQLGVLPPSVQTEVAQRLRMSFAI